jgi:Senescence regulator
MCCSHARKIHSPHTPHNCLSPQGTSAPIAIPNMMNRWRSDGGRSGAGAVGVGADVGGAAAAVAATFVPPHQLSRQEDFAFSFSGASPSATIKRDRLRARNAILRSTGFLEPGAVAAAAAATGEGLPLSAALPAAAAAAAAAAAGEPGCGAARTPATSTLTAALTTIGEL